MASGVILHAPAFFTTQRRTMSRSDARSVGKDYTWDDLLTDEPAAFFRGIEGGGPGRTARLPWLHWVAAESIVEWATASDWVRTAARRNDPDATAILALVLSRLLFQVSTRLPGRDGSVGGRLADFWQWYAAALDGLAAEAVAAELRGVWDGISAARIEAETDFEQVAEQEGRYTAFLELVNARLARLGRGRLPAVGWAADVVRHLLDLRAASPPRPTRVSVPFALDPPPPPHVVPAGVVLFEVGTGAAGPHIRPGTLARRAEECFAGSVRDVRHRYPWRFRPLVLHDWLDGRTGGRPFPPLACPPLPVKGRSGGFGLAVAQALAGRGRSLAPWVAVAADLDARGAAPVGQLGSKLGALARAGIRVAVIDNRQREADAEYALPAGMVIRRCRTEATAVADLADADCLTDAAAPPTRRWLAWTGVFAAFALMTVALADAHWPAPPEDRRTLAERAHDAEQFDAERSRIVAHFAAQPADRAEDYMRAAGRPVGGPTARPAGPPAGVQIVEESRLFHLAHWRAVGPAMVTARATEYAYITRVVRLRRAPGATGPPGAMTFEYNTSGFGVVLIPTSPTDRFAWCERPMAESGAPDKRTYTMYHEVDLPADLHAGAEHTVTLRAVLINGFQDRTAWGKADEWCAMRVFPGTEAADLTVWLPDGRTLIAPRREKRVEEPTGKTVVVAAGGLTDHPAPVEDLVGPPEVWESGARLRIRPFQLPASDPRQNRVIYSIRWGM